MEQSQEVIAVIAGLVTFAMFALTIYAVSARYLLGWNTAWAFDSTELMMLFLTFLPLALISRAKAHVSVDLISRYLSKTWDTKLTILADLIGLVFAFLITWRGWVVFWQYRQMGSATGAANVPMYPFMVAIPVGGFLFFLELLTDVVRQIRRNGQ